MKCERCKGKGKVKLFSTDEYVITEKCYMCGGTGKMDWISLIFCMDQTKVNAPKDPSTHYFDWSNISNISSERKLNIKVINRIEFQENSYYTAIMYETSP